MLNKGLLDREDMFPTAPDFERQAQRRSPWRQKRSSAPLYNLYRRVLSGSTRSWHQSAHRISFIPECATNVQRVLCLRCVCVCMCVCAVFPTKARSMIWSSLQYFGFDDSRDYYEKSQAGQFLESVRVPLLAVQVRLLLANYSPLALLQQP